MRARPPPNGARRQRGTAAVIKCKPSPWRVGVSYEQCRKTTPIGPTGGSEVRVRHTQLSRSWVLKRVAPGSGRQGFDGGPRSQGAPGKAETMTGNNLPVNL